MENNQITTGKVGLRYGVILALVSIIYSLILNMTGLAGNQAAGLVGFVFLVVAIILGHNYYKSNGDGYMSFGKAFGIGALIAVINAVISSIFTFVYLTAIDNSQIVEARDKAIEEMEKRGSSDQEIDQAMQFIDMMVSPLGLTLSALLGMIFFGIILAVFVSIFTQKKNETLDI